MTTQKHPLHQPIKNPWILGAIALIIVITFVSLYVNKAPGAGQAINVGEAPWTGGTVNLEVEGTITFTVLPATRQDILFSIGTSIADPAPQGYNFSLIKMTPQSYRFIVSTLNNVVLALDTLFVGGAQDQSFVYLNDADATPELEVVYQNGQVTVRNPHYISPDQVQFSIINSTGTTMPGVIRLPEGTIFTGLINASSVLAPENLGGVLVGAGELMMNNDQVRDTVNNFTTRSFTYTAPAAPGANILTLSASVQGEVTTINYTFATGNFQQFHGAVTGLPSGQAFLLRASITGNESVYQTPLINGQYGYLTSFLVLGRAGDSIMFSVVNSSGTATPIGTAPYQNTVVTTLNFQYIAPLGSPGPTAQCGNNIREASEICDGTDLAGQTCVSQVGTGSTGTLRCTTNCMAFNTSHNFNTTQCTTASQSSVCWQCNDWGTCRGNNRQTRNCARLEPCDVSGSNVFYSEPSEERFCQSTNQSSSSSSGSASCSMNWECGAWSLCRNAQQTRICFRADNCNTLQSQGQVSQITSTPKPAEERSCQQETAVSSSQCSPGLKRCAGGQLQQCAADGAQWNTLQTCTASCDPISLTCQSQSAAPPQPPQKPSSMWMYLLAGSVVLVLIIVSISMALLNKKKYAPAKEYIQESRDRGIADAQIKEKLVDEGWDEKAVGKLFR